MERSRAVDCKFISMHTRLIPPRGLASNSIRRSMRIGSSSFTALLRICGEMPLQKNLASSRRFGDLDMLIFIAGPYSDGDLKKREENVRVVHSIARSLMLKGHTVMECHSLEH